MKKTYCSLVALLLISPALRAQDMPLSEILIPGEGWDKIEGPFKPIMAMSASRESGGSVVVFAAVNKPQAVVKGNVALINMPAPSVSTNDPLFALAEGCSYHINEDRRSLRIDTSFGFGPKFTEAKLPLKEASILAVSPDKGSLLVGDAADRYIWVYRIGSDGSLSAGEKYITMRVLPYVAPTLKEKPKIEPRSDISAIIFDSKGRTYAATNIGVQVFDPTGRLCGVLTNPSKERLTAMCFGGAKEDRLYIACGTEVYWRRLNATGKSASGR